MSDDEVTGVCVGLEEEGFIKWPGGDVVEITARGCRVIDDGGKQQRTGGDIYNTHIDTVHGGAQIGSGNIQNINITSKKILNYSYSTTCRRIIERRIVVLCRSSAASANDGQPAALCDKVRLPSRHLAV
jgi:hypothetical protein